MSEPEEKEMGTRQAIFYLIVFIIALLALIAFVEALGKADGSSETRLQTVPAPFISASRLAGCPHIAIDTLLT
jgi:hypothetical protein